MKKILIVSGIILTMLCIIFAAGCISDGSSGNIIITNSDGTTVTLNHTAERIVLLNSNAGEILYILGDADKVVGISQSIANNAEQVKMYPNAVVVGAWNEPDVEYLISLDADLVIGYASSKPKNADVLASAGIPIVYIDCTKPETMTQDIVEIGKISGNVEKAQQIAEYYNEVITEVKSRVAPISWARTIYAESYTAYWGQGTDTGMGQLISIAGGQNIMTDAGSRKISDEWVVSSSPGIIVKLVNNMNDPEASYDELVSRTGFNTITAVKDDQVWLIRNDLTYGPRSCAAAVALAKMIHPGVFEDMSVESVLTEFNTRFGTEFDVTGLTYPVL
ncbi:MAG: ABC transporter substrate-binding protein [Methanocorpusculum sp.]|uniref:ABC transporter substrate-binding protein n=1 Tax=Methanocorpusculum sp. TaxID=2058474 RepID=UPI00271C495A|nr:ABC transporter substrate-binding protein [Methanocorpusculum sp.]MDO9522620.1 ABC transporter substrate-binding protein [Methanocorpusculum sp.]